jgi:hypothetical protein
VILPAFTGQVLELAAARQPLTRDLAARATVYLQARTHYGMQARTHYGSSIPPTCTA